LFALFGARTIRSAWRLIRPIALSMLFDVIDTGIGTTEEQVGRLFQAFT